MSPTARCSESADTTRRRSADPCGRLEVPIARDMSDLQTSQLDYYRRRACNLALHAATPTLPHPPCQQRSLHRHLLILSHHHAHSPSNILCGPEAVTHPLRAEPTLVDHFYVRCHLPCHPTSPAPPHHHHCRHSRHPAVAVSRRVTSGRPLLRDIQLP